MSIPSQCNCILERIFDRGFGSFSFEEKLKVVQGDPSRIPIIGLETKTKRCVRHFNVNLYRENVFLCGCNHTKKLYCWPCVLFSTEQSTWSHYGFDDLNNFHKSYKRHTATTSVNHILCLKQMKQFGKNRIEDGMNSQRKVAINTHNKTVKKNRKIVGCLVRVACFLSKQGLAFRGHNEKSSSTNRGNYVELVNEFAELDDDLMEHLENSTVFSGLSSDIQNDIITSISDKVLRDIKEEISKAQFVSIILDETTDVSTKSQFSHVLRYVTEDGEVKERFICFTDVSKDRTANGLYDDIVHFLNEMGCGEKLIAQTYDGASVMSGQHNGLQAKIKENYNNAIFIHCYAHKLNLVLSQSVNHISECKIFFTTLSAFGSFFNKSTSRSSALNEEVQKRFPSASPTRWNYNSRIVGNLHQNKDAIMQLLQKMVTNENSSWDAETINGARGLLTTLTQPNLSFLLIVFQKIFAKTTILFNILQTKWTNMQYCLQKLEAFKSDLATLRNQFHIVWSEYAALNLTSRSRRNNDLDEETSFQRLYFSIIDALSVHMSDRFSDYPKLRFMGLFETEKFDSFVENFPEEELQCLRETFGKFFDFVSLKNELSVVYASEDMKLKIFQLFKYIKNEDLTTVFPETFKLLTLILTIPVTSAAAERSFSALKRIKTYLRNTQGEERLSCLALINIESEFIAALT
ncbi:zinc finger MYM-type protein 1-like [Planococcus citri]|uniref:zinc finger MYM-type protein 1-like n=1 Tax=Planococcus citri TaxID=170843 RepID=UPI0031F8DC9B